VLISLTPGENQQITADRELSLFRNSPWWPGSLGTSSWAAVHYAKSYRPFELFVNENYKL